MSFDAGVPSDHLPDGPYESQNQALGMYLARAMDPEAWEEFDEGDGVCTNEAGLRIKTTIEHSVKVLYKLEEMGLIDPNNWM